MSISPNPLTVGDQQIPAYTAADSWTSENSLLRLQKVTALLMDLPSYDLSETTIPGSTLKWIVEALSPLGINLVSVLPVSSASLYRQYKKEDIDTSLKDHLISLLRIVDQGLQTWENEQQLQEWLNARIENLGNRRPIDLLHLETGRREVEQALARIEYGLYG
uniref:DUF2384 domain-containing protein n=1 Tax=Roseihalotalea indica TaxID=2867963 RepID=A0AA49GLQ7_9BACT|nr:DUF2384 domain-containing protein [Tunicatimonas sp. TK19036]